MENLGPTILDRGRSRIRFRVFARGRSGVTLLLKTKETLIEIPMIWESTDLYSATVEGLGLEARYKFRLDREGEFPDPYSHYQPEGVHGYSQVVDHAAYRWQDEGWPGINWEAAVIYELHTGAFSEAGTFQSAAEGLDRLVELGVNTVELMPVTQTPGRWNWGYDGAGLFSVNHNYGTPDDLKYFVDSCHRKGLAVLLDVVYNHFGPEGNYLSFFGPYFTEKHETPWGAAINFDDAGSAVVRRMVLDSARHWLETYHFDGLRLDAVHAIKDESPRHILQEIGDAAGEVARACGREAVVIAETDENDVRLINPPAKGGYGLDAQWMDDFHHTVHTVLTGEDKGYYQDYGDIRGLAKVLRNYLYTGEYSRFWKKKRGTDASQNPGRQFVVAVQTHDQVGNRARGERLAQLVDFPYAKAAAGLLLTAPYIPMLFMGEEYAEENPFLFFTDYIDPELKKAVSEGRKKEFAEFGWDDIPDPEDDQTFYRSKLTPREQWLPGQEQMFRFYRDLIRLRATHPALRRPEKKGTAVKVDPGRKLVEVKRVGGGGGVTALFNLGWEAVSLKGRKGRCIFDSEAPEYGGGDAGGGGRDSKGGKDDDRVRDGGGGAQIPPALKPGHFILLET
jgi:maltooligosyltrehalose trehalohydrolase